MALKLKIRKAAKILSCLTLIAAILCSGLTVLADEPYKGYNFNYYGEASAPNGYLPVKAYNGTEWGVGYLENPTDMYVDKSGYLYILDAGNGRIIKTDSNLNLVSVIDTFTKEDGTLSPLNSPQGLTVTADGEIYICDTNNNRVIVTNQSGQIRKEYFKPKSSLLSETLVFLPKKIEVTDTGDLYIIADNIVDGALVITENGEYKGYFGTDAVTLTEDMMKVVFWRMFMTDEQIKKMMSPQPVPFDNMYLDGDFLYTATTYIRDEDQIRKVNPAGNNLFAGNQYGEAYSGGLGSGYEQAAFNDVNVTDEGFFFCLDKTFCKIFMYNQDNELLTIFGGDGDKLGRFDIPVAIESIGRNVVVLDAGKKNVTLFEPTYYGNMIMDGSYRYEHGDYEGALEPWNEVLKLNVNSELAYRGIARAEYLKGEYKAAMEHYAVAYDNDGYSEARQKYRAQYMVDHFSVFMGVILIIAVALYAFAKNKKKIFAKIGFETLEETGYAGMKKWKYPFYNLVHPSDGMSEMRYNKKESLPLAIAFIALWYVSAVVIRQYEDYIFNTTNKNDINIFMILATTVGIVLVGCISNWAITTLVDGKGTFKNIFIYASYSLIPSTVAALIVTFISHYMIKNEAVFVQAILFIGYAWTAILLFIGMMNVHDFTFKKALLMTLLTAVGMLLIVFLLMLLTVLYSQVVTFVTTIMYELFYKFAI